MKKILPVLLCFIVMCSGSSVLAKKKVKNMSLEIAKTCTAIKDGYFQNAKSTFSASIDKTVFVFARFKLIDTAPYKVRFSWYSPNGLYYESDNIPVSESDKYFESATLFQSLDISNMAEYGLIGKWRTSIKVNETIVHTVEFVVEQ